MFQNCLPLMSWIFGDANLNISFGFFNHFIAMNKKWSQGFIVKLHKSNFIQTIWVVLIFVQNMLKKELSYGHCCLALEHGFGGWKKFLDVFIVNIKLSFCNTKLCIRLRWVSERILVIAVYYTLNEKKKFTEWKIYLPHNVFWFYTEQYFGLRVTQEQQKYSN